MANIVDIVAGVMPWAGSLVPATITYRNVQVNLGFEPVEALIVGIVVEGLGFVTITTVLDLYEHRQDELREGSGPQRSNGTIWVAVGGVVVYIAVVELVNAVLSGGDPATKLTMALLSLFGLLGGLMVALRNQLMKRRAALRDQQARETAERARAADLQAQIDREERGHQHRLQEERLRLAHELKLKKLESSARQILPESSGKVSDGAEKYPGTFGRWKDWRKVPESVKKDISKLQGPEEVSERYGVSQKTAGNWWKKSRQDGGR